MILMFSSNIRKKVALRSTLYIFDTPSHVITGRFLAWCSFSHSALLLSTFPLLSFSLFPLSKSSFSSPHKVDLSASVTKPSKDRSFMTSSGMDVSSATSKEGSSVIHHIAPLTIVQFPCLSDNYGFLVHDETTGATAAIDVPDAKAYRTELTKRGWTLTHIFNTHHHWDHTGGNKELLEILSKNNNGSVGKGLVQVYGPVTEQQKIPCITHPVRGTDIITSFDPDVNIQVLDVGGHTAGHIAYYFPNESIVFAGDSLFAMGCGKMFEGTPSQFWSSLLTLRQLPDETKVYCAHEYSASNAKFALSVEPGNDVLVNRAAAIYEARKRQEPTVPTTIGIEKLTNPFFRCDVSDEIRTNVGFIPGDSDSEVFAKVRRAKDMFR